MPNPSATPILYAPPHVVHRWVAIIRESGEPATNDKDDMLLCCSVPGCEAIATLSEVSDSIAEMLAAGLPILPDDTDATYYHMNAGCKTVFVRSLFSDIRAEYPIARIVGAEETNTPADSSDDDELFKLRLSYLTHFKLLPQ